MPSTLRILYPFIDIKNNDRPMPLNVRPHLACLLRHTRSRSGAGLGEYALLAALIAGVSAIAVTATGIETRDLFSSIASTTRDAGGSGAPGAGAGGETALGPGENFGITLGTLEAGHGSEAASDVESKGA